MVTHQSIIDYAMRKAGVSVRTPFDPNMNVLFVGDKMFALLGGSSEQPSVNLKAEPETAFLQRQQYPTAVLPGYHMNKKHWNTVLLNGVVPDAELYEMVDESYLLVFRGLPRAVKNELSLSYRQG